MLDEKFRQETLANEGIADRLHKAFDDTGITFHDRAATLKAFKEGGREITFDEGGQPFSTYDAQTLPLADALARFGWDFRSHVDGRSLPREGAGVGRPGMQAKSDFPTTASKVEAINRFGEEWWASLPLTSPDGGTGEITTRQQFDALPVQEKVRRIHEDENCRQKLPNAPRPDPNAKALGQRDQMSANLAKHVASKGVGRR